jgi:hypothetical protein
MTEQKKEPKHYGMELGPGQYVIKIGPPAAVKPPPTLPHPWRKYFIDKPESK